MRWVDDEIGIAEDWELEAVAAATAEVESEAAHADLYATLAGQQQARALDEIRAGEDALEDTMGRRGTDEARMQRAAARIAAQTYLPPALAERDALQQPGMVTGFGTCGPSIEGYCSNSRHSAECGSVASTEVARGLIDAGVYRQVADRGVLDATGAPVTRSDGLPATIGDIFEQNAGERLHGQADFENGQPRPEVARIGREDVYGHLGDTELLARARQAMNIGPQRTGHERGAEQATRAAVAQMAGWKSGRAPHTDYGESTREGAERMRGQVQLQPHDEPVNGSTGSYRAG